MHDRTPGSLIQDFLEISAARLPDKIALVSDGQRYTYAQLDAMSNRLANALRSQGIERGDRIAVFLENSLESYLAIFAILKAGAVFTVVNHQTKPQKLCYILNDCRAAGLVTHTKFRVHLGEVEQNASTVRFAVLCGDSSKIPDTDLTSLMMEEIIADYSEVGPKTESIDLDLASIIYTSGTTGFPKGACFSHRGMVSISHTVTHYLENIESDIILDVLPLSHGYGLYQALMSTQMGATLILEKSFAFPQQIVQAFEREQVTGFAGVPTIYAILLQLKDIKQRDFASMRYLTNAAAALPPRHVLELQKVFPNAKVYSMYGITEAKRVSYMPPEELHERPDSVGKGMPNQEVYIVDEDGQRVGPGVVGELVVRGSNVMMGYWEKPEENAKILRPGKYPGEKVLYTGDLFRMDEDGYLYFVSRKDDIIKSGGEKVPPKEIENILYELPQVLEAAVIGVDDEILGQAVKAFIVLKDGMLLEQKEVIAHCRRNLESLMIPKHVEFVPELPKTSSGKTRKKDLRDREDSGSDRAGWANPERGVGPQA
jgi:amino acid adenylation domain-containing protein